ncbi:unnamed protein product, partial [Vitrella brassicaformis CCMP3155]
MIGTSSLPPPSTAPPTGCGKAAVCGVVCLLPRPACLFIQV